LEDHNRLADYNILTNSSVDFYVTDGIQISVNIPSVRKIIKLNVKKSDRVADVKAAIEEEASVLRDEQILMCAGQQLEDHQTLSQCGLSHGQTLHALVCPTDKLRISVNVEGLRIVNLDVKYWYTVADVKLLVETMVGIPAFAQILVKTQSPDDAALVDTETLQSLHIKNNEVVMLHQSIQLFIRT
jgi:ubiquitin C